MEVYIAARKGLKTSLSMLESYLSNKPDNKYVKTRIQIVNEKYSQFMNAYQNISEESSEIEIEVETISDKYFKLHEIVTDLCEDRNPKLEVPIMRENILNVKLPDIKLPTFSGDFLKWPQFRDTFVALISNNSALPNINKFHYLRSSLQGEAKALMETANNRG